MAVLRFVCRKLWAQLRLLTPQALERLLSNALRKQHAADYLLAVADEVAAAGVAPMSMEEINAEVAAAREERRSRADRH